MYVGYIEGSALTKENSNKKAIKPTVVCTTGTLAISRSLSQFKVAANSPEKLILWVKTHKSIFPLCREIEHHHLHSQNTSTYHGVWAYISELQFRAIFFVCSIVVLACILLYCRRLGRMSRASLSVWNYMSPKPALYGIEVIPSNEKLPVWHEDNGVYACSCCTNEQMSRRDNEGTSNQPWWFLCWEKIANLREFCVVWRKLAL